MTRTGVRRAAWLVVVVATLSLVGCAKEKGAPVPAGHERFDQHGFSFLYEKGWQVKEEPGAGGQGRALFVTGPDSPARVPPQIAVGWQKVDADFNSLLLMDKVKVGRPDMQIAANGPAQVPGAKNAQRIEATYPVKDATGADRMIKSVYLFLEGDDHQMLDVVVRSPVEDFDRYALADVVTSFRLT
jgi:hypothetical protein